MIRAIITPLKLQTRFLLGRCQTPLQVRPTSSILRSFGRDVAVLYLHGRRAKDYQLEDIPSTRPMALFRCSDPSRLRVLLYAHAWKPAKLHMWARSCGRKNVVSSDHYL